MAEKKAVGHAYNIDFLNVVFAASSIFLFISVIWMVWDDYDREWKNYQRRFVQLEQEVTEATLQRTNQAIDQKRLDELAAARDAALQEQQANRQAIADLQAKLRDLDARLYRATQDFQFAKANYDVNRYDYEVRVKNNPAVAATRGPLIEQQLGRVNELNLEVERLTAEREQVNRELGQYTGKAAEIEEQIQELTAERNRLEGRLRAIAPSLVNTYLLNAPLMDFMAPTIKVRQVITPNILDDVNFTRVPKMDRCMTCHLAIDREGYENYPQPFRTHPNLSVYVGGASPHPLETTGCTVCHEGMGQSVTFFDAAHTPASPAQRQEWEERYHWEPLHFWDFPMLPVGSTEASCAKCHRREIHVPEAPQLNLAYATYERAGCYACHKTKGFENLRKPGPDLTRIDAKLTPDWVKTWIRDPRAVKASTWMPRVWYNSNSNTPADHQRNEVEIEATVAYLFANTTPHQVAVASPPRGNPEAGRRIVESVGCLGCHIVDESREAAGPRRTFGQPLQNIGNKTSYEWLFDWVRDPKHVSPNTYMPDLRLTDREVADVAAYLATLRGPAGEPARASVAPEDTDEVLLDYLRSIMPLAEARATIAEMDPAARQLELGRRVISRYGCFSCHEIKGFEDTQPIGIELSEEGSKLLTQLDFAHIYEIPHTKLDWFRQKIEEPRIFDRGRVLQPLEKLRMPDFGVSEVEKQRLVTAIMSLQRDVQPPAAWQPRTARVEALSEGRTLTNRRNCVACHEIERDGGDYRALVEDPSLAPPPLTPQGAKVQPDWMYAFLRGPITIRPWLDVRMPTFHLDDADLNRAIRYFQAISDTVGPFRTHEIVPAAAPGVPPGPAWRAVGRELFELLRCQQCHVLGAIPADQPTANLAPDLRMAAERLQPDWILDWLRNPARIQPGTRMPAFWPDHPKSFYTQLNGDAELQIRAIRDYMLTFRGGPNPKQPAPAASQVAAN